MFSAANERTVRLHGPHPARQPTTHAETAGTELCSVRLAPSAGVMNWGEGPETLPRSDHFD